MGLATLDRIETFTPWTPSASGIGVIDDEYIGKHRKPGAQRRSLLRYFYIGRHRSR